MRTTVVAVALLLLVGCASSPRMLPRIGSAGPDAAVGLSARASTEALSGRARELVLHALSHVGAPYRFGGSSPETGFDCSGLVHYVYSRAAGLLLPRTTDGLSEIGVPVSVSELEPGDLVFFDTLRRPNSHVGIYLGDHRFVHAPATGGYVELVNLRARYWQSRFSGARRPAL